MPRVFITGSADGLGLRAGEMLAEQGHRVVLHARNDARTAELKTRFPGCEAVVVGDVSTIAETMSVAQQVNVLGRFDAVIHNVAIGTAERRVVTSDGMTEIFAVNVVAPYLLTALIAPPQRLIYLSSDMHAGGDDEQLRDPQWESRPWNGSQAYSDTKLHDLTLSMLVARRWTHVLVNAVNPGWVATRMGGRHAPGTITEGAATQAWLAVSDEPAAKVTGCYFYHRSPRTFKRSAARPEVQERLIEYLEGITQVRLP
jgi:NAD(P)-dependent dehydrogenase (short-subunit alcohol dehydrogenase family)